MDENTFTQRLESDRKKHASQIEEYKTELDTLRKKHKDEINNYHNMIANMEVVDGAKDKQLKDKTAEAEQHLKTISDKENHITHVEQEIVEERKRSKGLEAMQAAAEAEKTAQNKEYEALRDALHKSEAQYEECKAQLDVRSTIDEEGQTQDMHALLEESRTDFVRAQAKWDQTSAEIDQQLQNALAEVDSWTEQNVGLVNEIAVLRKTVQDMQNTIDATAQSTANIPAATNLEKELEEAEESNEDSQAEDGIEGTKKKKNRRRQRGLTEKKKQEKRDKRVYWDEMDAGLALQQEALAAAADEDKTASVGCQTNIPGVNIGVQTEEEEELEEEEEWYWEEEKEEELPATATQTEVCVADDGEQVVYGVEPYTVPAPVTVTGIRGMLESPGAQMFALFLLVVMVALGWDYVVLASARGAWLDANEGTRQLVMAARGGRGGWDVGEMLAWEVERWIGVDRVLLG